MRKYFHNVNDLDSIILELRNEVKAEEIRRQENASFIKEGVLLKLIPLIIEAFKSARDIIYQNNKYKKPGMWKKIKLGAILLKLILQIIIKK